jgi:hypothetical protein
VLTLDEFEAQLGRSPVTPQELPAI